MRTLLLIVIAFQISSRDIPLDTIWGYRMPGTKDVWELDPQRQEVGRTPENDLVSLFPIFQISQVLGNRPKEGEKAGMAFIITGSGEHLLVNTADVLTGRTKRQKVLPADTDLTLVFYSYSAGVYVRLVGVEWTKDDLITIKYHLVKHLTMDMSRHFALIPLGKLTHGRKIRVTVKQVGPAVPTPKPAPGVYYSHTILEPNTIVKSNFVCNSFSFKVQ